MEDIINIYCSNENLAKLKKKELLNLLNILNIKDLISNSPQETTEKCIEILSNTDCSQKTTQTRKRKIEYTCSICGESSSRSPRASKSFNIAKPGNRAVRCPQCSSHYCPKCFINLIGFRANISPYAANHHYFFGINHNIEIPCSVCRTSIFKKKKLTHEETNILLKACNTYSQNQ